jgi:hypothetical protein
MGRRDPDKSGAYDSGPKTMLTVFISVHAAVLIDWLSPGEKFDNGYSSEQLLEPLSRVLHMGRGASSPRPIVHFDNAAAHRPAVTEKCSQSRQFRPASQIPYSPNICLCDFFLLGDLKTKLKGEELESTEEL